MNVREGSRRIKHIGQAALIFAGILFLLGVLAIVVFRDSLHDPGFQFVPLMLLIAFYPAFFGGLLWMAGWIVEGFAKPAPENIASAPAPPSTTAFQNADRN